MNYNFFVARVAPEKIATHNPATISLMSFLYGDIK